MTCSYGLCTRLCKLPGACRKQVQLTKFKLSKGKCHCCKSHCGFKTERRNSELSTIPSLLRVRALEPQAEFKSYENLLFLGQKQPSHSRTSSRSRPPQVMFGKFCCEGDKAKFFLRSSPNIAKLASQNTCQSIWYVDTTNAPHCVNPASNAMARSSLTQAGNFTRWSASNNRKLLKLRDALRRANEREV